MPPMTGVEFGIDAASYQGRVNWAAVDQVCAFGWEKVTQGLTYANPYWPAAKAAMRRRAAATGFTGGAYLFLEHGSGAAQARRFHDLAGDLSGLGLAIDAEPSGSSRPSLADAIACAAELNRLYPGHPVGGYVPHWYWGGQSATWADWLWASDYVNAYGSPPSLYEHVPASWWNSYGGRAVRLLQFTNRAVVGGVVGGVDCSAFRGTAAEYASMVAGGVHRPLPGRPERWQVEMMNKLPELRHGSAHTAFVRRAQALLGPAGAATTVDGDFGPATAAAVQHVQRAHGITVDGVIGHKTWGVLVTGAA